jgi:hypothetical protein
VVNFPAPRKDFPRGGCATLNKGVSLDHQPNKEDTVSVTVEQVEDEIMQLSDIAGNRCYASRSDMRKHYSLQAIANECTERSIVPSPYSQAFWNIVTRFSY